MSNTVIITFWFCTLTAAQIHDINNLINMNIAVLANKRCVCVCGFFFKSGVNHLIKLYVFKANCTGKCHVFM